MPSNYFLRVIATLRHYSQIVSDILSGSIYMAYIYILTFELTFCLAYTLTFFVAFYLAPFLTYILDLSGIYSDILSGILSDLASILPFYLAFYLTLWLAFCSAFSLAGVAHCISTWRYEVRVHAWPTASGAGDMEFGSQGIAKGERRTKGGGEGVAPLLKSI